MTITKSGSAKYDGLGKGGKGHVSTQSGALKDQPYGFNTRFDGQPGTNPEELIAAAHASCFTMALAFQLADAGYENGTLETTATVSLEKQGEGFTITKSALKLTGDVPEAERAKLEELARKAKENCPVSKVLNAEITLEMEFA